MKEVPLANATHLKTPYILGHFFSVSLIRVLYFLFLKEEMQANP